MSDCRGEPRALQNYRRLNKDCSRLAGTIHSTVRHWAFEPSSQFAKSITHRTTANGQLTSRPSAPPELVVYQCIFGNLIPFRCKRAFTQTGYDEFPLHGILPVQCALEFELDLRALNFAQNREFDRL